MASLRCFINYKWNFTCVGSDVAIRILFLWISLLLLLLNIKEKGNIHKSLDTDAKIILLCK